MYQIKRFIIDEYGLEVVEYAIILGLIIVGVIGLIIAIGNWVQGEYGTANDKMNST